MSKLGEAFSFQKRTSSTSKNEIYSLFSLFVGHFCPRIRIHTGTALVMRNVKTLIIVFSVLHILWPFYDR
jgi:hypothetical protein